MVNRREFIQFLGGSSMALLGGCAGLNSNLKCAPFPALAPTDKDDLVLAPGFRSRVLVQWNDSIGKNHRFGFNNDYTAFLPLDHNRALFWVNHEYVNPLYVSGFTGGVKSKKQVDEERYQMGGSLIEIQKSGGLWKVNPGSRYNGRITAATPIPFAGGVKVDGATKAIGMVSNCAGGVTPWGSILTCEENYDDFYGEKDHRGKQIKSGDKRYQWTQYYPQNPLHHGWVVEVDPKTLKAVKHTTLGRFAHESATVTTTSDGRAVVYSGDDKAGEHLYKFVSDNKGSLEKGTLYVADTVQGKWLPLDLEKSPQLKKYFKKQIDVYAHARFAAKILGATPLDRPEDIEVHPQTGDVYVALSNNYNKKDLSNPKNNFYGSILKVSESDRKADALKMVAEHFVLGGEKSGLACPDNLAFDRLGNLWVATDISGSMMNREPFSDFKNNGLFYIPLRGVYAGRAFQVASAPVDAELTGLSFSSDYKTLFVSVQHPGERSKSMNALRSHWPSGGNSIPRPAVVQISGPAMEKLM